MSGISDLVDFTSYETDMDTIEEGLTGKIIKINITSEDLEVPNNEDKQQILKETIKILKKNVKKILKKILKKCKKIL